MNTNMAQQLQCVLVILTVASKNMGGDLRVLALNRPSTLISCLAGHLKKEKVCYMINDDDR